MSGSRPLAALLRQLSPGGIASLEFYPLPHAGEVRLGRDPSCQIVLDTRIHTGVSRHHAKIESVPDQPFCWQICDLNSSNGTYVNGERLHHCRILHEGDRIGLGKQGPMFVFEILPLDVLASLPGADPDAPPLLSPDGYPLPASFQHISDVPSNRESSFPTEYRRHHGSPSSGRVTFSQLFPIVSTGRDLTRKAYLIPGIVTVLFVVLMFISVGDPAWFNILLAAYLSSAAYFFVYQLCGKHKPWWLLVGSALITVVLLVSPVLNVFTFIFREVLPGAIPTRTDSINFMTLLVQMFFGAGLMEELLKSLPVLLAAWIGASFRSARAEQIGVCEPLDGILLGTASAVGFTLVETLGQYVPSIVGEVSFQAGSIDGELLGLQLLIPRILGSVSGHMAYSGYMGYFIGLSVLKPKYRWRILIIGYLSASMLHALWNTTGFINPIVLALVGVLSYAFLAAAILKARALSPMRSQNFATRLNHRR
ncbi:MAG: PrsW family glutamic-type intramembrane protease [Elainellaceae cyanobacterium]